jgi:hypothetical protein
LTPQGSGGKEEEYTRFLRQLQSRRPRKLWFASLAPNNKYSDALQRILVSNNFNIFSSACVFVNVGFMLADHADASPQFTELVDMQNLIFFIELWLEVLCMVLAFGPGALINDVWKEFDLLVCVGTSAGYVLNNDSIAQFVKAFRLTRVIRLMIKVST